MAEVNLIDNIPSIVSTIVAILAFWNAYKANQNSKFVQEKMSERLREEQNRIDTRVAIVESKASERAHLDRTYERQVFLRKKYEYIGELSSLFFAESLSFMDKTFEEYVSQTVYEDVKNKNKLNILVILYFNELITPTNNLITSTEDLRKNFVKGHNKHKDSFSDYKKLRLAVLNEPDMQISLNRFDTKKTEWVRNFQNYAKKYTHIE